jgi:2-keto-4-pentenoate hydratase
MRPSLLPVVVSVYQRGVTSATDSEAAVVMAVGRLAEATRTRQPCAPVRDVLPSGDIRVAYRVQLQLVTRRIAAGSVRVGRKIGLTSPAVQAQLGVDTPDFGVLLDDMAVPDGGIADYRRLLQPKVEGEIAFRLDRDLDGDLDEATVRDAVGTAHAAIEIVDSRVQNWNIALVDTVSDNASSGLFTVSEAGRPLDDVPLADVSMTLSRNGEIASSGSGAACLGGPLNALRWLAHTAAEFGDPLRAGDLILSGALGPMVAVRPGDSVVVDISGLGSVSVSFSEEGS